MPLGDLILYADMQTPQPISPCSPELPASSRQVHVSRRECLAWTLSGALVTPLVTSEAALAAESPTGVSDVEPAAIRFRYCLNTSTIREQQLSLEEEVDLVSRAGYDGIEPWIRELEEYVSRGGILSDLKKRIADAGLTVESAIGFARWIVDDEQERRAGIEQLKRDMELVEQIGGTRIAAPPVGAHGGDAPQLDLHAVADRYRTILEVGREIGVTPQIEIWGPSKNLSRLGEAVFAAIESGHPDACLLPDIYHIFRGGSPFEGLHLIAGPAIHVFHVNDYPGGKARTEYNDGDRVYPGDGVAPVGEILSSLKNNRCGCALSLELFNRDYWQRPAEEVVRTGLQKMRECVEG